MYEAATLFFSSRPAPILSLPHLSARAVVSIYRGISPGPRGFRILSGNAHPLNIKISHSQRIVFDEGTARLDHITHQRGENFIGSDAVLDLGAQ